MGILDKFFNKSDKPVDPFFDDEEDFGEDMTVMSDLDTAITYANNPDRFNNLVLKTSQGLISLDLSPAIMGRDASCKIHLPSRRVSRAHAAIYRAGKRYVLRDLHSTNGVYLNGLKVTQTPIREGDLIKLGDQEVEVLEADIQLPPYKESLTIIFLDIQEYTNLCEKYGDFFSSYVKTVMNELEDQILLQMGCPIKNLGDGLMTAFGLCDIEDFNSHDSALTFARQAVKFIQRSISEKIDDISQIKARVGIAYGEAQIQSGDVLDIIGDTVNLASRLEYANKIYGTNILMNQEFYNKLNNTSSIREIDTVRVKGKQEPVTMYSYDQQINASSHSKTGTIEIGPNLGANQYSQLYNTGLGFYRKGSFDAAFEYFNQASSSGDSASLLMKERVQDIIDNSTVNTDDWDGVWNIEKE